jgi:Na+-translocating ferredoxin:NAD+ oxidoreductase RnfD subunit
MNTLAEQKTLIRAPEHRVALILAPLYLLGIGVYGWRVLALLVSCLVTGFCVDRLASRLRGDPEPRDNVILWGLFPLALPAGTPLWMASAALAFTLVVAVHLFGGPRRNLFNPIAVGIVFLQLSYPAILAQSLYKPFFPPTLGFTAFDSGMVPADSPLITLRSFDLLSIRDFWWGQIPGNIGESFPFVLLAAGGLLLYFRLLDRRVVVSSFLGLALFAVLGRWFAPDRILPFDLHMTIGAFLPFTLLFSLDAASLPRTPGGRWAWGFLFSLFTVLIRGFSGFSEGVFFAAILAGIFCPIADQLAILLFHGPSRRAAS